MSLERRYSLREAAGLVGLKSSTLRRYLVLAGFVFPRLRHGSPLLLTEAQIEAALRAQSIQFSPAARPKPMGLRQ
ncbi:MAG TPA: hypothetical protein VFC10_15970 [Terriglobia bacterium]|jgi:hypothetical protein|nr:hypothetical protein [Terriglobia bacterium]